MLHIEIVPVLEEEKSILSQLIELYEYDFSEFTGKDINAYGRYGYSYLDYYWTEEKRSPFFIKVDGKLAGFVLICDYCYILKDVDAYFVGEFFVMRKYRKLGVGSAAAKQVFDRFKGHWELTMHPHNPDSYAFWTKVVSEYTHNEYTVHHDVEGIYDDLPGTAITFHNGRNNSNE